MIRTTLIALFCTLMSFTGCPLQACGPLSAEETAALEAAADNGLLSQRAGQETGEHVTDQDPYQPQVEAQKQQEAEAAAAVVVVVVIVVVMLAAVAAAA
ncbi:MAG: hypothetical protein AB7F75_01815 [Planctomycetota bacterium]